ncbi:hypothetical protein OOJ91_07505 [Micromonospora lupini]|uniref:hypothetical protein n=1 Tax=Micromonospora lupini TaxID=285679 RepID=UPI00225063F4|nr:hypothetical protein [Micromonospora lupini]MCX5065725.1 hypothetical protein [Micromonospora lupini]
MRRPKRCLPPAALGAAAFGAAALGAAALGVTLGAEPAHADPSPSPTTRAPTEDATAAGIVGSLLHDVVETPLDIDLPLPTALPLPVPTTLPLPVPTTLPLPVPTGTAAPTVEPSTAAPTRRPRARLSTPPPVAPVPSESPAARPTSPPPQAPLTARASVAGLPRNASGRAPTRTPAAMTAQPLPAPSRPVGPLPGQPALVPAFASAPAGTGAGGLDQSASATDGPPAVAPLHRGRAVLPFDSHAASRPVERGPPPPRQLLIFHRRPLR